jgi:hydrogenase expression/formation protein HypC
MIDAADELVQVRVGGVTRTVHVGLLGADSPEDLIGSWVLIHVGFALSVIDEQQARATLELLAQMGSEYEEELSELRASAIE